MKKHFELKAQFIFIISTLSLAGCLNPKQQDEVSENIMRHHNNDQSASFYLGRTITGTSFDHRPIKGWGVASSRQYTFRACLSDRITNSRIIGHEFEVLVNAERQQKVYERTDDEGCLSWTEEIPFNYFAPKSSYITLERRIRGTGVHFGARTIQIAVNPWRNSRRDSSSEIIDLSKSSIPETQAIPAHEAQNFLTQQFENQTPIEVRDLSVRIDSRQALEKGNEIEINLSLSPRVVMQNLLGEKVIVNLTQGDFDIYAQIVASSTREEKTDILPVTRPLLASTDQKSNTNHIRFNDDKMDITFTTDIERYLTNGHYDIVLRVIPHNIQGLEGHYAVYRFGDHSQLIGSRGGMRPRLSYHDTPAKMAKFDDKLQKADFDAVMSHGDLQSLSAFRFGHMDIRFMRVLPDETTTERTIAYRSEVCVRRTIDGRSANFEDFVITREDGTQYEVNTEDVGCFSWVDTVTHQYYQPERLIGKKTKVTHIPSGQTETLRAYINPWDYGWTFGQDERKLSQEYIDEVNSRDAISSELFLSGYGYETIRFRYEIDEFLNLQVKKALLLDIQPRVLRYNSITRGRNAIESLRDGVYLLKIAVQKDYYDPRTFGVSLKSHPQIKESVAIENAHNKEVEFISAVKKLVRVKFGRIITPIEISVNDLRLMRIRSNFLIEISPIDERALGITPDVPITELDPATILEQMESLSEQERIAPRQTQTSDHNLSLGNLDEERFFSQIPFDIRNNGINSAYREERALENAMERAPDIDDLIAVDSGLPSRTFVGPIIMLSNNFGAGVRPTDELTEVTCTTIDCDFLKIDDSVPEYDNDPHVAKFYGSAKHLHNITVTELIKRQEKIQLEYINQQTYESLLSRYTDEFMLDYISFGDTPLKTLPAKGKLLHKNASFDTPDYFTNLARQICGSDYLKDCLVAQEQGPTTIDTLLYYMNFSDFAPWARFFHRNLEPLTREDLLNFVRGQEMSDQDMAARLCHTWTHYMMGERVGKNIRQGGVRREGLFRSIFTSSQLETIQMAYHRCVSNARKDINNVFHISTKLRPTAVDSYRFLGGKSMNFNVGASFSLNYGESLSSSLGAKFDPLSVLKKLGGVVGSILGVFSVDTGWSASQSRSLGEGTSVSSGTYLAMQRATMDLFFESYERCLEIRMQPGFFSEDRYFKGLVDFYDEDLISEAFGQGLFLCTGEQEKSNIAYREMYYYFTQHFTEGDMLDNGDLLNHPWLLALRGERDYAHFVNLIQATPVTTQSSQDFDLRWLPNNVMHHYLDRGDEINQIGRTANLEYSPIDQLVQAYQVTPPTFPGLYTVTPKRPDYPNVD